MTILLPLLNVWKAKRYPEDQLQTVDTVSEEEKLDFTKEEWQGYVKGWYSQTLLPEIVPPLWFNNSRPVVRLAGELYRVYVESRDYDDMSSHENRWLVLEQVTEESLSENRPLKGECSYQCVQMFGQPRYVQRHNEFFPMDTRGNPCYNLMTVENGWGDSGNWNILVGLGEDGLPLEAYFEASCC